MHPLRICLAAAFVLPACQTKVSECNKLAEIVNQGVAKIGAVEERVSEDPAQLAKDANDVADLAEKTAAAIAGLTIKTAELAPRAETYHAVASDMAKVSREFAGLMDRASALKGERLTAAEGEFTRTQAALEQACAAGGSDCTALAAVLKDQPENPDEDRLGELLAVYIEDLKSVTLADAEIKAVVDAHLKAVAAYKSVVDDWSALQAEVDDAAAKLDAVVEREDTIVVDLNTYCVGG